MDFYYIKSLATKIKFGLEIYYKKNYYGSVSMYEEEKKRFYKRNRYVNI